MYANEILLLLTLHFIFILNTIFLELYSLNLRKRKKKEIDLSNLLYTITLFLFFELSYDVQQYRILYHCILKVNPRGNERCLTKKLCVDVTLRSCNYCHYCTITMCTTIVAPRAQASNQVSFSSGEQTIKCFFIISLPFSLFYICIYLYLTLASKVIKKKKLRNGDNF